MLRSSTRPPPKTARPLVKVCGTDALIVCVPWPTFSKKMPTEPKPSVITPPKVDCPKVRAAPVAMLVLSRLPTTKFGEARVGTEPLLVFWIVPPPLRPSKRAENPPRSTIAPEATERKPVPPEVPAEGAVVAAPRRSSPALTVVPPV